MLISRINIHTLTIPFHEPFKVSIGVVDSAAAHMAMALSLMSLF